MYMRAIVSTSWHFHLRSAKMFIIVFLCLCLATNNYQVYGRMSSVSQDEDLDLEKQLKFINKPSLKTIQTDFGHIVDCVDINKQLAFDHPLLKNHKLQLKPSFQDTKSKLKQHDRSATLPKIGVEKELCPRGTVPIRRTTKDDLIRAKRISNIAGILTQDLPGNHFAEVHIVKDSGSSYHGISGTVTVYNPAVARQDQTSSAYIWVQNGPDDDVNCIFFGWQVYPALYGDNKTYIYTTWADNSRHTGCSSNMPCSGFVLVDQSFYFGIPVDNTSTYEGPKFETSISLYLDPITKNWWVRYQNKDVGYFPAALFSNMSSADGGGWGGRTAGPVDSPSPPMGSGHFTDDNFRDHGCYFRQMKFKNKTGHDLGLESTVVGTFNDNDSCYHVKYYGYEGEPLGYCMQFGGPGGNCGT